jgi:hypothetical protein
MTHRQHQHHFQSIGGNTLHVHITGVATQETTEFHKVNIFKSVENSTGTKGTQNTRRLNPAHF